MHTHLVHGFMTLRRLFYTNKYRVTHWFIPAHHQL
uniref:Uncharacterized protein n=1 Tax=Anguilla anguilla TaxID=7936 RepID=A0A0E9PDI7_ANGAN